MDRSSTSNVRVTSIRPLLPPAILVEEISASEEVSKHVETKRNEIVQVLQGHDDRLVIVVGPCSIHDPKAGMEYAVALKKMADQFKDSLIIVMRVYFEKPRTTVGWKGLINDPDMDGSFNINKGLRIARDFLLQVNKLGLPAGVEFLDTISPQFLGDLVSWGAIGARTTESQVHRELASGCSCAIGFKNATSGDVQVAVDACRSAISPHSFLGVTEQGLAAIVTTSGNDGGHVILRGGSDGTNYDEPTVEATAALMKKHGVQTGIVVDCSHGNSLKDHNNQPKVASACAEQIAKGSRSIVGLMIESNVNEGKQSLSIGSTDVSTLKYGVSVTDACVDLPTTQRVLQELADAVIARRTK